MNSPLPDPDAVRVTRASRVCEALLLAAVLAAIVLALGGVVRDPFPASAVAVVNGHAIARGEYDALLERLGAQLGHEPTAAERAEVLERLIDEELLIQRGLALDLPRGDVRLRGQLVQEVMRQSLAGIAGQPVDGGELAAFFAANESYFRRPALLRALRYDFATVAVAQEFRAVLAGAADRNAVLAQHEQARSKLLPDAPMNQAKLGDYLGADTAARIAALERGGSLVQEQADGRASVVLLLDTRAPPPPALETQRAEIEAEFRRRRDEQAVAEYLRRLREDARIVAGNGA